MAIGTKVGEAFVELRAKWDTFNRDIDGVASRMEGASSRLTSLGSTLTTRLTLPIIGAGAAVFKMAADSNEAASKLQAVFGAATQDVNRWIGELRDTIPETTANLRGMTAEIGDLLIPLGLAPAAAQEMTQQVVELAGDLASFNNIPMAEALERIRSGLVGQNEPLLKFGVAINAAMVEARALELGLIDEGDAVDAAARAQASFSLILERTTAAHGDAARTSDSAANSLKFFWASVKELADVVGQRLLPVLTPLIIKVTDLVQRVMTANPAVLDMGVKVAALVAALGPVVMVVGKVIAVISALNPAIIGVTAALAAGVLAWKKWGEDIVVFVQATINVVWPAIQAFANRIVGAARWLYTNAIRPIIDFVSDVGSWLLEKLGGIIARVAEVFGRIIRFMNPPLADALDNFGSFVDRIGDEMTRLRKVAADESEATVEELGDEFSNLGPGPSGAMTGPVRRAATEVRTELDRLRRDAIESGRLLHRGQEDVFSDIEDAHGRHWGTLGRQTTEGYREIFARIGVEAPELVERLSGPWRETRTNVETETRSMRDAVAGRGGLIDAFGGEAGQRFLEIKDDIAEKWGAVKGILEATIGLENWNTWKDGVLGFFGLIRDDAAALVDTVTNVGGGGVTDAVGDVADSVSGGWIGVIVGAVSNIVGGAISGIISSRATKQSGQAIVDQLRIEGAHLQAWLFPRVDLNPRMAGDIQVIRVLSNEMAGHAWQQLLELRKIEANTRGGGGAAAASPSIRVIDQGLGTIISDDATVAGDLGV